MPRGVRKKSAGGRASSSRLREEKEKEKERAKEREENFPVGMRIMVVDDCPCSLAVTKLMLGKCEYDVTGFTEPAAALARLRERKGDFDLVVTDVHMPEMDGFQLLQAIVPEIDIPVVLLSTDVRPEIITKGIKDGACDYLVKPGTMGQFRNIWQHVYRKKLALRKKKRGDDEETDSDETKKVRVKWTPDLHQKFAYAVSHLGIDKAVPKKILQLMNIPNLTKEHIASHLQKFRLFIKKSGLQGSSQITQEMLATFSAGALYPIMDHGGFSGTQNDLVIPEHAPILLQQSPHPFHLQPPHLVPSYLPSTCHAAIQPQEWTNFQPPNNPLLAQPYNHVFMNQSETIPMPVVQGPNYTTSMGQVAEESLRDVNMMQNYPSHETVLPTGNYICASGGLARPNTESNGSPWLGMEASDQVQIRNLDFVGDVAYVVTDGDGSRYLDNDEDVGEDFVSGLLNSPKEDDLGPDV